MSTKTEQSLTRIRLKTPYLLFFGDATDPGYAKTGLGVAYWAADSCAGQMGLEGCRVDLDLPHLSVEEAVAAGVGTVIIGVAPVGGQLPAHWLPPLVQLAEAGIDIASGLHNKLKDIPSLVNAAQASGAQLIDVRVPPADLPIGNGRKRTGKRVLMVGTDCAVGKKYSALALHRELSGRGVDADFRATGQTGIMIAGAGIPIDAVVSDFLAGAAECLSPDNSPDHWDVIEGQGSLHHPIYAGVSLGLLHGSQPDAVVLCHDANRAQILGVQGDYQLPPLQLAIDTAVTAARLTNPDCFCSGISVNTSKLPAAERETYLKNLSEKYQLPCVDPVATGMREIADYLLEKVQ